GDRTANAARTANGLQPLVTGDGADHHRKDKAFEQAVDDFAQVHGVAKIIEKRGEAEANFVVKDGDQSAAHPPDLDGENHQDRQGAANGDQPGQHQVVYRVDVHRAQGVDFLID